jgi:hypothetical protein
MIQTRQLYLLSSLPEISPIDIPMLISGVGQLQSFKQTLTKWVNSVDNYWVSFC